MSFNNKFLQLLKSKSFIDVFNPYTDLCEEFDVAEASNIRSNNLLNYIEKMDQLKPSTIWIAEALGHRGGRRTGLAMTGDSNLNEISKLLDIQNLKPSCNNQVKEMTANQVWSILEKLSIEDIPFLWNIFPFHPYQPGKQTSNRPLKSIELQETEDIFHRLFEFFQFDQILTIGKKSFLRLQKLGYNPTYIRHPSHGGSKIFRKQMSEIYTASRFV
ncbi:MAG: hypothetical protein GPJ54_09915 [Candidatus Heimdallarchaeota archaeon]|nr:hypothetical protein [Candidatus Heimdallarchaeota archaeon]